MYCFDAERMRHFCKVHSIVYKTFEAEFFNTTEQIPSINPSGEHRAMQCVYRSIIVFQRK